MKKLHFLWVLFMMFGVGLAEEKIDKRYEHDLFIMPTAFTLEKGQSYFTNYELFFINYGFAVTPSTHLAVFSLFPVTGDFVETVSIGFKQNLAQTEKGGIALFGSYTPKVSGITAGGVFSLITGENFSLHGGLGLFGDDELDNTEVLFLAGVKLEMTQRSALIAEYTNFETGIEEDFAGFINIGVRYRTKSLLIDFGGLRPLESSGDLIFFPFIKGTVFFGTGD